MKFLLSKYKNSLSVTVFIFLISKACMHNGNLIHFQHLTYMPEA